MSFEASALLKQFQLFSPQLKTFSPFIQTLFLSLPRSQLKILHILKSGWVYFILQSVTKLLQSLSDLQKAGWSGGHHGWLVSGLIPAN